MYFSIKCCVSLVLVGFTRLETMLLYLIGQKLTYTRWSGEIPFSLNYRIMPPPKPKSSPTPPKQEVAWWREGRQQIMEKFILWDTLYKDAAIQFFVSIIPSFFPI